VLLDPDHAWGSTVKAVLINKTDDLGHHGCTLVNRQIDNLARGAGIEVVAKLPLHSDWNVLAPAAFDAVIVNGEGTLHSNSQGARRIAEIPAWAEGRGAPAHLINSVYQGNSPAITEAVARFHTICVRDQMSAAELADAGIVASVIPDLSLTWQVEPASLSGKPHVNGSTIKETRNSLHALANRELPYLPILAQPPRESSRLSKYRIKRLVSYIAPFALWRHRHAIPDFDVFTDYLRHHVSGIITGRFHMMTMALCLEIPVVAVSSNTRKMEALFEEIGLEQRLASSVQNTPQLLKPYSSDDLKKIRLFRQRAVTRAREHFSLIAAQESGEVEKRFAG
jgi:hypothetical protein